MRMKSLWILCSLMALAPAALLAEPALDKAQCTVSVRDFGTLQGFADLCPQTLLREAGSDEAVNEAFTAFAKHDDCVRRLDRDSWEEISRSHPVVKVIGEDGQRRFSQAEAGAFCRQQRPELRRILRQYRLPAGPGIN